MTRARHPYQSRPQRMNYCRARIYAAISPRSAGGFWGWAASRAPPRRRGRPTAHRYPKAFVESPVVCGSSFHPRDRKLCVEAAGVRSPIPYQVRGHIEESRHVHQNGAAEFHVWSESRSRRAVRAAAYFAGTRRFSSSLQFSTMSMEYCARRSTLFIRKRPSGATSHVFEPVPRT
jgi:hypothetical protein